MVDWVHYSVEPLTAIRSVEQNIGRKPQGLWITPRASADNWYDWCLRNDFHRDRLQWETSVALDPGSELLLISTPFQLAEFNAEYLAPRAVYLEWDGIDWPLVSTRYPGILITPYLGSCRFDYPWYGGWDCASGCVWDSSAVSYLGASRGFAVAVEPAK